MQTFFNRCNETKAFNIRVRDNNDISDKFLLNIKYLRHDIIKWMQSYASLNASKHNAKILYISTSWECKQQIHVQRLDPRSISNYESEMTARVFDHCAECNYSWKCLVLIQYENYSMFYSRTSKCLHVLTIQAYHNLVL